MPPTMSLDAFAPNQDRATQMRPERPTQAGFLRGLVVHVAYRDQDARIEVSQVLDDALAADQSQFDGAVFHGSQTPRASARRALYDAMRHDTLFVKDGHGFIRLRVDALRDVIVEGDVMDVIRFLPSASVDTIIADPAWTYIDTHRSKGTTTRMVADSHYEARDPDAAFFEELYRVLKPASCLCMYLPPFQEASADTWLTMLTHAKAAGFHALREITWKKQRGMGYRWTGTTEPIMAWYKPGTGGEKPACEDRCATNFIEAAAPRGSNRTPFTDVTEAEVQAARAQATTRAEVAELPGAYLNTEKPVAVAEHLLRVAGRPGGLLLDAWAGSGSASVAAKAAGMDFLAIEKSHRHAWRLLAPRLQGYVTGGLVFTPVLNHGEGA